MLGLGEWKARRAEYWFDDAVPGAPEARRIGVSTVALRELATVPKQLAQVFAQMQLT